MKLKLIKLASVLMVLSMVFALAIPVFAEGEATEVEPTTYTVTVHYGPVSAPFTVEEGATLAGVLNNIKGAGPGTFDDQYREFQGWFCHGEEVTADTVVTADMDIYAKYASTITVGDKVLNKKMIDVKYQLAEGDFENTADIRFVTSIDDLNYNSVSFKISLDDTVYTLTSHKAYTALSGEEKTPAQAFVADSQYFVAYTITNLPTDLYEEITVQAVLELTDGTTVEGTVCTVEFNG